MYVLLSSVKITLSRLCGRMGDVGRNLYVSVFLVMSRRLGASAHRLCLDTSNE
jgi:hypothetical protein